MKIEYTKTNLSKERKPRIETRGYCLYRRKERLENHSVSFS